MSKLVSEDRQRKSAILQIVGRAFQAEGPLNERFDLGLHHALTTASNSN